MVTENRRKNLIDEATAAAARYMTTVGLRERDEKRTPVVYFRV